MNDKNKATKEITQKAHAKINLTLDVTGRRDDGYHLVKMVMQSVELHDIVRVSIAHSERAGITLTCNRPDLPVGQQNLAYRAAALFYAETGVPLGACTIDIEKRIPVAAGLAGGSTDAAAVLRALDSLHHTGLSDETLCRIGLKLGADVPYCLLGGTMLAEGIGEKLSALPRMMHAHVVLCKPPFAVSTQQVYHAIDTAEIKERPDTDGIIGALERGDYPGVCEKLSNVMETVTAVRHREIDEIKAVMTESGADGALMSGTGPTVYGLFADRSHAEAAVENLKERFADTFLTETP